MESGKRFVKRLATHVDIILLVYAIKRLNRIPSKYNKVIYAGILSPIMLTAAWLYHDRIATRYRFFLVKHCFPEVKRIAGQVYNNCSSHKEYADLPLDSSCWHLFKTYAPLTVKNVSILYMRFYVLQMLLVMLVKRRRLDVGMVKQTALNIARSTAFLAGQTITMRITLCVAEYMGVKLDVVKTWLLCYICSLCIWFERTDRVRQINNLVFAHIVIGWLKKNHLLQSALTVPVFLGVLLKDKGRLDPVTALIAMFSTVVF